MIFRTHKNHIYLVMLAACSLMSTGCHPGFDLNHGSQTAGKNTDKQAALAPPLSDSPKSKTAELLQKISIKTTGQIPAGVALIASSPAVPLGLADLLTKTPVICLATVLDFNHVLTARHCLPMNLTDQVCNQNVEIRIPQQQGPRSELFKCKSVTSKTAETPVGGVPTPDWVVLELDRTAANVAAQFKPGKLAINQELNSAKLEIKLREQKSSALNPNSLNSPNRKISVKLTDLSQIESIELVATKCKNVVESVINPFANSPLSATLALAHCDLNQASAGAPIVATTSTATNPNISETTLVALATAPYDIDEADKASFPKEVDIRAAVAANLECISLPYDLMRALPTNCIEFAQKYTSTQLIMEIRRLLFLAINSDVVMDAIHESANSWTSTHSDFLSWSLKPIKLTKEESKSGVVLKIIPRPECFRPNPDQGHDWLAQMPRAPQKANLVQWAFEYPIWEISLGLTPEWQMTSKIAEKKSRAALLSFDANSLASSGHTKVRVLTGEDQDEMVQDDPVLAPLVGRFYETRTCGQPLEAASESTVFDINLENEMTSLMKLLILPRMGLAESQRPREE